MTSRWLIHPLLLGLLLSLFLYGCSEPPARKYVGSQLIVNAPIAEMGYVNPSNLPVANGDINRMRAKGIEEIATSLGATGALAWRSEQINASLERNADQLNQVFDFNQLLLAHNVVPPVLVQGDNSLNLADADSIRLASKTYRIVKPAHFTTTPPTWREYLWLDFKKPDMPDQSLLPRDQAEAGLWNHFLKLGWKEGVIQANDILDDNLNRLKRDYSGMVLYRKLLTENIVSAPYVAKADLGVTGDNNEIRINDQILRITAQSELQPDSSKWQAVITKENGTVNYSNEAVTRRVTENLFK